MIVAIPTLNRANRQLAFARMPDWLQPDVRFFTNFGQSKELAKYVPKDQIIELGDNDGGIATTRQRMVEWCEEDGHEKVWMLDDHGVFYFKDRERGENKLKKLVKEDDENWRRMLGMLEDLSEEFPWVGISERSGNNRVQAPYRTVTRSHSTYALNLPWLRRLGVRFDTMYLLDPRVKTVEDYQAVLTMLVQGVPNAVIYEFCNQFDHGRAGGCNTYRNNPHRKICAYALQELFPDFVTAWKRPCKVKTMDGAGDWRWDVKIYWQKAFQYGLSKSGTTDLLA